MRLERCRGVRRVGGVLFSMCCSCAFMSLNFHVLHTFPKTSLDSFVGSDVSCTKSSMDLRLLKSCPQPDFTARSSLRPIEEDSDWDRRVLCARNINVNVLGSDIDNNHPHNSSHNQYFR